ncbi:MAG: hypothetical protein KDA42_15350 [Planctomycetales bacterium]|nr:hypothetical protein [Planctomycetales bacterium]
MGFALIFGGRTADDDRDGLSPRRHFDAGVIARQGIAMDRARPKQQSPSPLWRQRILFALTAAATFVIAATLFVGPAPTRSVEAIISWVETGTSDLAPGLSAEMLESEEFLAQVVAADAPQLDETQQAALLSELRTALHIERLAPSEDGRTRLSLQYRGQNPRGADLVNAMAQRIVQQAFFDPQQVANEQYEQLASAADSSRKDVERLEGELLALREEGSSPRIPQDAIEALPSDPQPNPRWLALKADLAAATARHDDMLLSMSPQHPAVRSQKYEIEDLRQQLAATEQYLDVVPALPAFPAVGIERNEQAIARLETELSDARSAHDNRRREAEDAMTQLVAIRAMDLRLAQEAGPLPPPASSGGAGLISLVLAVFVGRRISQKARGEDTVFRSVGEAASALPLRIVGVLKSSAPIAPFPLAKMPWSLRAARAASVAILAVASIAFVGRLLASEQFAAMALRVPVRALAEAMHGLL